MEKEKMPNTLNQLHEVAHFLAALNQSKWLKILYLLSTFDCTGLIRYLFLISV